jgi:hypothetical protein
MFGIVTGTDLAYNIVEQILDGSIDGVSISAHAVAGGRAGSKMRGVVNPLLANNPYATGVKAVKPKTGGPLVMGRYYMKTKKNTQNWITLEPFADNEMKGRSGFAIHGRGPRGSDGCIVPTDFNMVQEIYKLVKAREKAGSPAPTLAVIAAGDLDFIERRLQQLSQTA